MYISGILRVCNLPLMELILVFDQDVVERLGVVDMQRRSLGEFSQYMETTMLLKRTPKKP